MGRLAPRKSPHHAASWLGLRPASARETVSRRSYAATPRRTMGFRLSRGFLLRIRCPCLAVTFWRRPHVHHPARRSAAHGHRATRQPPSWSGQLRLGSCCVPVKAYPTISSTAGVSLRQLHAGCGEHIEYHKCCPKHGRVPADQIVKGYPYSAEQCVALTEEDLATLEPTDDKTIHLEHFLSPTEFDLTLLAGRSLYLAPAHPAAMKPFVVIRQAMLARTSGPSAGPSSPTSVNS